MKPPALPLVTALLAAPLAHGGVVYDFFLVESFNPNYNLAETSVYDINESNVGVGNDTFGGFRWMEVAGKVKLPVSSAHAINDDGLVLFKNVVMDPDSEQTLYTIPAPAPTHPLSTAHHFNNNLVAVGNASTGGSSCEPFDCPYDCSKAFVWDPVNGSRFLPVPDLRVLHRVNNGNVAIGQIITACDNNRAVVYDLNTDEWINLSELLPPIDYLGLPAQTEPADISDAGHVIGLAVYAEEPESPFIWTQEAGFTFIPAPPGSQYGYVKPRRVNVHGHVIGEALDETAGGSLGEWRAFLYTPETGSRYLDELAETPTDFILGGARGINDAGWITGFGHFGPGWATNRGVVLKPLAPPAQPEDLNGDGAVTSADLNMLLGGFGCTGGGCGGDIDGDGDADSADLNLLLGAFGG